MCQNLFSNLVGHQCCIAAKLPKDNTGKGNQEWRRNNLPYLNKDQLDPEQKFTVCSLGQYGTKKDMGGFFSKKEFLSADSELRPWIAPIGCRKSPFWAERFKIVLSVTFFDFVDNVSFLGLRGSFRCFYLNRNTSGANSCKETICP